VAVRRRRPQSLRPPTRLDAVTDLARGGRSSWCCCSSAGSRSGSMSLLNKLGIFQVLLAMELV
jgi:hypothetical protein